MKSGKVPPHILKSRVFRHLGVTNPNLLLGPEVGEDASIIRIGERVIIASTDPITGSIEDIGWLAVHVNANDIATFGVRPSYFLISIIMPSGSTEDELERIMEQIHEAASALGITIAGGHTEVTEGIDRPIVVGFMLGETSEGNYVTSKGARPGDSIILTKSAAIEGTAILATEGAMHLRAHLDMSVILEGQSMRSQISVVDDGVIAFETGFITAMHDPTEGGIANGIHELCDASNVGCIIEEEQIPIATSTLRICDHLGIDPLQLISSGSMLITCDSAHAPEVTGTLNSNGVPASVIGTITEDTSSRILLTAGGKKPLPRPITDELWRGLALISS